MKLFLDATTVRNGHSGTGIYTEHMLSGLSRPNNGHQIVCLGDSRLLKHKQRNNGLYEVIHNVSNPHLAINIALCGNRPGLNLDGSFFPNYFMPPGWPWPAAVTIHDVSFLTHPHHYSRKMTSWYTHRIRHTLKAARLILTVSQSSKKQLVRYLGIEPERIRVHIPCWAHICRGSVAPQDRPYLLYIGNMEPRKNVLNLIEAYQRSGLHDIDLILIGKMHASHSWTRRFNHLVNQTPGVNYKGYVSDSEMCRYLLNSRGFVNLSYVEGFGISHLDALANGIPALISNDPAMVEIAQGHSLITDMYDIRDIANRLNDLVLVSHKETAKAAAYFRQMYSRSKYFADLDKIILELTEKRQPLFPGIGYGNAPTVLEQAIVSGVCYAGVFSSGIHDDKLYHSLSVPVRDKKKFYPALLNVVRGFAGKFQRHNGITALNTIDIQPKGAGFEAAQKTRVKHRRLIRLLGSWPWIRALYYSGGTVHGSHLEKDQDLDLFVVCSSGRVWLVYTAIRLISKITGRNHSFCCNYLVDEHSQEIYWQRDFYTAFQMLFLRQVLRKQGTQHVRQFNTWIYRYFPNAPRFEGMNFVPVKEKGFADWLNLLAMYLWTSKWRKRGLSNGEGGMLWDFGRIKLHTNDHRPWVYSKYERLLNEETGRINQGKMKREIRVRDLKKSII